MWFVKNFVFSFLNPALFKMYQSCSLISWVLWKLCFGLTKTLGWYLVTYKLLFINIHCTFYMTFVLRSGICIETLLKLYPVVWLLRFGDFCSGPLNVSYLIWGWSLFSSSQMMLQSTNFSFHLISLFFKFFICMKQFIIFIFYKKIFYNDFENENQII